MDNVTHTLTGIALSQAGLNRKTRFATAALILASNLPDVDVVARLGGSATYLKYHRGITHSLLGITVLAGLLAAVFYYFGRKASPPAKCAPTSATRPASRINRRWLFMICWIGTAGHLLMDFTNAYGVRPFLPFSGRWYAWDIMPIIDPLLLAFLAAGLGLSMLFRLVSEEVGARKPGFRRGAIFSLCCLVLLWGARDLAHRRVLSVLDSHTYAQKNPTRLGAFPSPANPFAWIGVVETDSAFHLLPASAWDEDVDAENARVFHTAERSAALEAAMKTRTATTFSGFARFLWAQVNESEDGFEITLRDLRFFSPASRRPGFVAEIELDKNLHVRSESFSFTGGNR